MEEFREMLRDDRAPAFLIVLSLLMALGFLTLGAAQGWMSRGQGPGLAFAIWIAGAVLSGLTFLAGLGLGLARAKGWGAGQKGPVEHHGARIAAVLRLNSRQEPIWNEGVFPDEDVRTYVRIIEAGGRSFEVEADPAQLAGLGEGMKGTVTTQGDRFIGFVPDPPEELMAFREGFRPDV
ncbi:MAG: hypothetical protein KF884_07830 [Fimbriimonadaceae bacterium]|nr:hypothetical protein [Fimbriimonadaceae bacterium]QYK57459.1 MAG: hypothetical protein KF884_07830 [Fimbriimonadaceae bacterium]